MAPAASPVLRLMVPIQGPLPISRRKDFSFVPELQCIRLKQKRVLCTAEINIPVTKLLHLESESRLSPSRFSGIYYLCQQDYL